MLPLPRKILMPVRRVSPGWNALLRAPQHGRAYTSATDARTASRTVRMSYAFAGAFLLGATSYLYGAIAPPRFFELISPRTAPPAPPADSEEGRRHTEQIEKELQSLPLLKRCREAADADEWYETRPYTQMPPERVANHFTAGVLRKPGALAVPPILRAKKDETESWAFFHLGRGVCGHEGIVHGGLLATLLDEGCGRNAVLNVPSRMVVTANLNLDFKAPTRAGQFVVLKARLVEIKGRKATVEGRIEDMDGNVLVQARVLFIEPKMAKAFSATPIHAIYPTPGQAVVKMAGAPDRKS